MRAPTLQMTGLVPVADIDTRNRLRPVSEAGVESIIASVHEVGVMKDPIHLRRKKGGQLVLIAGGHRLEAAKRLGWTEVEAKVWVDVTDDWSRMMEIDDNLAGAELNPLDTALFLAARKDVYERLHPETRRGIAGGLARQNSATDMMSVASFATATAEKFGMTDRHVRRLIAAGAALQPAHVERLRQAERAVSLADLQVIAKADPGQRVEIVDAIAEGTARSAAEAFSGLKARARGVEAAIKDPVEEAFSALSKTWSRAPVAAKRRFLAEHFGMISLLLTEVAAAREAGAK